MYVQQTPRLGPVPRRQRRRKQNGPQITIPKSEPDTDAGALRTTEMHTEEHAPAAHVSETPEQSKSVPSNPNSTSMTIGGMDTTAETVPNSVQETVRDPGCAPNDAENDTVQDGGVTTDIFQPLDALLEMDNSKQCLVFSPFDSFPRLDFDDLRLDPGKVARMFKAPTTSPSAGNSAALPSSIPSAPQFMRMNPLGLDAEKAGDELVAQTQQLAESLLQQMRERGLNVPCDSVNIEGIVHSAALRSAALQSAAIHSAAVRSAALRTPWYEGQLSTPVDAHSPITRASQDATAHPYMPKQESTAVPSDLWIDHNASV